MAPRGPKPKPAGVRDQIAPVRSRRKAEPVAVAAKAVDAGATVAVVKIAPPAWLKGEARKVWDQEAPGFINARLLGRTDVVSFARWCQTMADWLELAVVLKKKGQFYDVQSNHGKYIRAHPAAARMDRLETRLVALEDRFGGNPSARQRIIAARAQSPIGDLFTPSAAAQPAPQPDPTELPSTAPAEADRPTGFLTLQ